MEQKPSDEAQKTFDFSSLWSLKTSMKNVAHFMLVAGLVYFANLIIPRQGAFVLSRRQSIGGKALCHADSHNFLGWES